MKRFHSQSRTIKDSKFLDEYIREFESSRNPIVNMFYIFNHVMSSFSKKDKEKKVHPSPH